jgi:hypothetical protein
VGRSENSHVIHGDTSPQGCANRVEPQSTPTSHVA